VRAATATVQALEHEAVMVIWAVMVGMVVTVEMVVKIWLLASLLLMERGKQTKSQGQLGQSCLMDCE
jgi:hypothetical protein